VGVFARQFRNGIAPGNAFKISAPSTPGAGETADDADVAIDRSGNFVITWTLRSEMINCLVALATIV
jgi:hypothetical protein